MRDFVANLLFGGTCFVCRGRSEAMLCSACVAELPRLPQELCMRCALPSPRGALCGRCLAEPPAFDATTALFAYEFPADALVQALKFRAELALAPLFGAMLAQAVAGQAVDYLVPVPLSPARLRGRGFNQAVEVARHVMPRRLELELCRRARDSAPQVELPWDARRRNVRGAFECARAVPGATIAVLDDVMTTGATLEEVAKTLKRAGAARVVNWVIARTLPPA